MGEENGSEDGFSAAERAAMKQRAAELKAQGAGKGSAKKQRERQACAEAIAALDGVDRTIAERFHRIVGEEAPDLDPKTWYGFPSYARDGKVIMFVQPSSKFDTRYTTIGFSEHARLDDGALWATSFAVLEITEEIEQRLRDLVRKASS